jgi:hypothetical protein
MEAVGYSEKSVSKTTRNHIPENRILSNLRLSLKFKEMYCLNRYFKKPAQAYGVACGTVWLILKFFLLEMLCEAGSGGGMGK